MAAMIVGLIGLSALSVSITWVAAVVVDYDMPGLSPATGTTSLATIRAPGCCILCTYCKPCCLPGRLTTRPASLHRAVVSIRM
ncbi:hypothetical protein P3T22_000694 [Paraburkholderia sp. GAS348]